MFQLKVLFHVSKLGYVNFDYCDIEVKDFVNLIKLYITQTTFEFYSTFFKQPDCFNMEILHKHFLLHLYALF